MKKVFCFFALSFILFVTLGNFVYAEDKDNFTLYEWASTPLTKTAFFQYSYGKAEIFKDGLVTFRTDKTDMVTFNYYDLTGKLITSNSLNNIRFIIDMRAHDDYLYLLIEDEENEIYLLKLDTSLNVIAGSSKIFSIPDDYMTAIEKYNYYYSTIGNRFLFFEENDIYVYNMISYENIIPTIQYYRVDYGLENLYPPVPDVALQGLYFHHTYGGNTSTSLNDNYTILADDQIWIYSENSDNTIKNEEYVSFTNVNLFDNRYIAVFGAKTLDENTETYIGDLLVYDMGGNVVFKKSDNTMPFYLSVSGNKLVYGDIYTDGICTWDMYYYEAESGCDAYYSYHVYSLDAPSVNGASDINGEGEVKNPNTNSSFVFVFSALVFGIGTFIIIVKNMSKLRFLKK